MHLICKWCHYFCIRGQYVLDASLTSGESYRNPALDRVPVSFPKSETAMLSSPLRPFHTGIFLPGAEWGDSFDDLSYTKSSQQQKYIFSAILFCELGDKKWTFIGPKPQFLAHLDPLLAFLVQNKYFFALFR